MTDYKKVTIRVPEEMAEKIERESVAPRIDTTNLEQSEVYQEATKSQADKLLEQIIDQAEKKFTDWLRERHKVSRHASKREELMKACTHPEDRRIYPDEDDDQYHDDMAWHCLNCGYAEYKGGQSE